MKYTSLFWVCFVGCIVAYPHPKPYGDCIKYCSPDVVPDPSCMETVCVTGQDNCTYCIFHLMVCPEMPECRHNAAPSLSPDGKCLLCPGQECLYEEQVYHVGDGFDSLDGVNTCVCDKGGHVNCTSEPLPPPDVFCSY